MPVLPVLPALYFGLLAFCLLLGGGLVLLAWRRPHQRQRAIRMAAGAVAAGALWFTAFPPLRHIPAARAKAILLTEGYSPDTLRLLLRRLGSGTPVWAYGDARPAAKARPLASLLSLAEQRPGLRQVHILGHGLPASELPMLGNMLLRLHPEPVFSGFHTAYWQPRLALGESLHIEGSVAMSNTAAPAWVYLRAAGTVRDSVQLSAQGGAFHLRYQPKTTGLALYELLLRQAGQPLVTEPVPVEITQPLLPAVLLLTAAPSFEFKFLKNYLAEAHYPVALRTSVSRGLVQTDFVNQPTATLDHLTPALLARYGIIVADAPTLAALSPAEAQALQAAINAGRLGLITLAEATPLPRAAPARADFTVLARPVSQATPQPLSWADAPAPAKAAVPASLQPRPVLRALVTGPNHALVAASRRLGLGFAVVSVVPETFRWALHGQAPVYASFWTRLLGAAIPPAPITASWSISPRWPQPNQPTTLHLTADFPATQPTVRALAGGPPVQLALRQDTRLPEWSTAQYWPGAAGWHEIAGPSRTTYRFYVYPPSAWRGPEFAARQQAVSQRQVAGRPGDSTSVSELEPWPAMWFFGIFLLAAGYLWLEEKL